MHRLVGLISRFGRDERGVFAVMFGLMAIVLIAIGGAVVDYVSLEQTRSRAQIALDAAALALQPEIYKVPLNTSDIGTKAQALMLERLGGEFGVVAGVSNVQVDVANGRLTLEAEMEVPTIFVALVGVTHMNARIWSQVTRKMLDVEVVMVLDNSGSMAGTPMANLKTAACNAVNILFYDRDGLGCTLPPGNPTPTPNITMGVVPFTSMVNIGTQFANAAWLDWFGRSSVAANNFDNDDNQNTVFTGPVNRRDLFTSTGTSWAGCVEARISPFDTTDDPPNMDERLFVPMFSPDTRDNLANSYLNDLTAGTCKPKTCTIETRCTVKKNKSTCETGTTVTIYKKSVNGVSTVVPTICTAGATRNSGYPATTYPDATTKLITEVWNIALTDIERQSRLCKYNGAASNSGVNAACPAAAVLPLTDDAGTVLSRINAMVASGNTNIQQGTVWGMHALTDGEPLTQAMPGDPGRVAKILIIMTDGKNEPDVESDMNGSRYFSWGFRYDDRLGPDSAVNTDPKLTAVMDKRTLDACAYARTQRDIEVYTIGLNASTATKVMMTACATSTQHAYFPTSPSQLNAVFRSIADKLSALRLSM